MKRGLSGYTLSHNPLALDYCIFECIASMLPVCDEVVVSDLGSTDGTLERLAKWQEREPKLRVLNHPRSLFPDGDYMPNKWVNAVREELNYDMQFMIDGDECLDPSSYPEMRSAVACHEPRIFTYINFWLDAQHHCPWGDGRKIHLMPTEAFIHVHGAVPAGWAEYREKMKGHPHLVTYHYSALRKREAFFAKCKIMSVKCGCGYADQALMRAEKTGEDFMRLYEDRTANSTPFTGKHPAVMEAWLLERGWKV